MHDRFRKFFNSPSKINIVPGSLGKFPTSSHKDIPYTLTLLLSSTLDGRRLIGVTVQRPVTEVSRSETSDAFRNQGTGSSIQLIPVSVVDACPPIPKVVTRNHALRNGSLNHLERYWIYKDCFRFYKVILII